MHGVRITAKNCIKKHCTRDKTTGSPEIKMGRQGKRSRGTHKARRGLQISKKKVYFNFLKFYPNHIIIEKNYIFL